MSYKPLLSVLWWASMVRPKIRNLHCHNPNNWWDWAWSEYGDEWATSMGHYISWCYKQVAQRWPRKEEIYWHRVVVPTRLDSMALISDENAILGWVENILQVCQSVLQTWTEHVDAQIRSKCSKATNKRIALWMAKQIRSIGIVCVWVSGQDDQDDNMTSNMIPVGTHEQRVIKSELEKIRLELVQRSKTMDVASKPATANNGQLTQLQDMWRHMCN